ncbi:MAG: helix-turn-helix domain-containing protein [Bacteroidia bacterium]|nr:LexA family transcriptional regulator [Bacteroidia bacterium]NNM15802.1 helix-turn-helix domain-containing protein [Bacteroidia bacterium]
MTRLSSNLKNLRKQKGLTQEELAKELQIKRSLIGSYEEGRAEPKLETLQKIANFFEVSIDGLIQSSTITNAIDTEGKNLRVLPITVNDKNEENIVIVPVPAAAGYLVGYSDQEYIEELPRFALPILQSKSTCRVFQIKGDSMLPVQSGSFIIAEYVLNWNEIKDGQTYVIITKDEGIVYKRVYNHLKKEQILELHSDNVQYQSYKLEAKEIIEVWKAVGYISFSLPSAEDVANEGFLSMMQEMKSEIQSLNNKLKV